MEELAQVKGVTREILEGRPEAPGLAEFVTVLGTSAINVNTASPTVLKALGFAVAEAQFIEAGRRPYLDLAGLAPSSGGDNLRVVSDTFRIEAWGELPGQGPPQAHRDRPAQTGPGAYPGGAARAGAGATRRRPSRPAGPRRRPPGLARPGAVRLQRVGVELPGLRAPSEPRLARIG